MGIIKKLTVFGKWKRLIRILITILMSLCAGNVIAAIIVHDSFFVRYERPDYDRYPGMYCYDRFDGSLPRELLTVETEDADLAAYYYPSQDPKGLVVVVHGYHAGADDLLPLVEALVKGGYAVFSYDSTGTYSSGGKSGVGMCQSLKDLDMVLSWLSCHTPYDTMPKLLLGHSLGGYAVTSVLALHPEVKACVAIAPVCDATTLMVEKSVETTNGLAYSIKPVFDAYQKYRFGDYTRYNAIVGINAVHIPVLIAQGENDRVITPDGQSVTAYLDEITNPNVTVYYGTGLQGTHTGIWHSAASEEYVRDVNTQLQQLESERGSTLTESELAAFYEAVDHRLYSAVNPELMELIFQTFEKRTCALQKESNAHDFYFC